MSFYEAGASVDGMRVAGYVHGLLLLERKILDHAGESVM